MVKRNVKWITIAMICIGCLIMTGCGGKTLHMKDYTTAEFSGLDTNGTVQVRIDEYAMIEDALGKEPDKAGDAIQYMQDAFTLCNAYSYQIEAEDGLSNGDEVKIIFTFDNESLKDMNLKLQDQTVSFKVEGLREGQEKDLFQEVELEYKGASPYAEAEIKNNATDAFLQSVTYSVENLSSPSDYVQTGDQLRVLAHYDEKKAEEMGYIVRESEKTYQVTELPVYARNLEEARELTELLKPAAQKELDETWSAEYESCMLAAIDTGFYPEREAYVAGNYTVKNMVEQTYLDTVMEHDAYGEDYRIGLVYQTTIYDTVYPLGKKIYEVLLFENAFKELDGTVSYGAVSLRLMDSEEKLKNYMLEEHDYLTEHFTVEQTMY